MPINNALPKVKLPVDFKENEPINKTIVEHLETIDVTILSAPSYDELLSYIPEFVSATWQDYPTSIPSEDREQLVQDTLKGIMLPTALETIGITFRIDNLDLIDVTHLIRHRTFSFSAQCTADRDLRHDICFAKPSIMHSEFFSRYTELVNECKQLYADMVDSKEISILDARTILPRCMPHFYYVKGNLKDIMHFIRLRLDEQIQPQSDNIVAMKLLIALCEKYPILSEYFEIGGRDEFYIKTALTGRNSNIYPPKKENDVFEYNENSFLYKKRRDDFIGSYVYLRIKKLMKDALADIRSML